MAIFPGSAISSAAGYDIEQSLRLNDNDSAYLSYTPTTSGDRKKWTFSTWFKISTLDTYRYLLTSYDSSNNGSGIRISNGNVIQVVNHAAGSYNGYDQAAGVLRDPSAWYHLVVAWNTNEASADDRVKVYLNGAELKNNLQTEIPQYHEGGINKAGQEHLIGGVMWSGSLYSSLMDGYIAETHFVDGQALDPTYFGEIDDDYGHWKAIEFDVSSTPTTSYGTNGFYLPFKATGQADGFNTVLWNGTSASQSVNGVGFSPDLVWIKSRDAAVSHNLIDSVRGVDKMLFSNLTNVEEQAGNKLTSFDSNGFTVNVDGNVNSTGREYVGWCWDAGDNNTPTGHSSVAYTGNGGTKSVTGLGFQPDLVWIKQRDGSLYNHQLFDSIRGADRALLPNTTTAEADYNSHTSFDVDGFTIQGALGVGSNGADYVAWCWDAGDSDPVTNTDGDITSTVKASTTNGFSIVSYTGSGTSGDSVGHGLSSTPEMIILKTRDGGTYDWRVYHSGLTSGHNIALNTTDASYLGSSGNAGYISAVDSSAFTLTSSGAAGLAAVNASGHGLIAYCFHSVSGYSKIGSYSGTGSVGNSITGLGFRPGFLMIKRTDSAGNGWWIKDSTRDPLNPSTKALFPNATTAEQDGAGYSIDFDSDGFTINATGGEVNNGSGTYIYMAFAGSYSDYVSEYNTDGSLDSRVKANPTYGFSIVNYTGNATTGETVGHGLSSAPEMYIIKDRSGVANWLTWHKDLTSDYNVYLNTTDAAFSAGAFAGMGSTSSVLQLPTAGTVTSNEDGHDYVAYCFHSVAGYSKISTYEGNGTTSNSITGLGFKPAWIMMKDIDGIHEWIVVDDTRDAYGQPLRPSSTAVEGGNFVQFDSDGFTIISADGDINTNGNTYIYMAIADTKESAFYYDESGNGNNFVPVNITGTDVVPDSPTNNFATLNPLTVRSLASGGDTDDRDFYEGNLKVRTGGSAQYNQIGTSTMAFTSGKWYAEFYQNTIGNPNIVGFGNPQQNDWQSNSWSCTRWSNQTGDVIYNVGTTDTNSTMSGSYTAGDIIGVALDMDTQQCEYFKNGTSMGSFDFGLGVHAGKSVAFICGNSNTTTDAIITANFGQDSSFAGVKPSQGYSDSNGKGDFHYEPPTGYLALCTANLPDPAVKPQEQFNTVLYAGNGTSDGSKSIDVGFKPDFTWLKSRSSTENHGLYDVIRGGTNRLISNSTDGESSVYGIEFDADGFNSLGSSNTNGESYVAWNWKANGGTISTNTTGGLSSNTCVNTDAGFSIATYTGNGSTTTFGHGLSQAPDVVMVKSRSASATNWVVYHKENTTAPETDYLTLDGNGATVDDNRPWDDTAPSSSVVSLGTAANVNSSGESYVAYCWHEVEGYSKFGSYLGNGSADGPFVYTGFRPAFVLAKKSSGGGGWAILDTKRDIDNDLYNRLEADTTDAEVTSVPYMDTLSNGFKVRTTNGTYNASGDTYIYMAFAEYPFKYTNARGTSYDKEDGVADTQQTISQSLRFNDDSSSYLSRTPASTGNRTTWTWSGWVKIGNIVSGELFGAGANPPNSTFIRYQSGYIQLKHNDSSTANISVTTTPIYRDSSAWYHIVVAVDTTEATASDRVKIYVNGEQVTSFISPTYPTASKATDINTTNQHTIGARCDGAANYFDGYMAEVNFVDGQALGPDHFGYEDPTWGDWRPKQYDDANPAPDYGPNGFYLKFASGAIGDDSSGNNNDFTANNLGSVGDVMLDSPTNNFCTMNPLTITETLTMSEGNLKVVGGNGTNGIAGGTFPPLTSGKWYFEHYVNDATHKTRIGFRQHVYAQTINNYGFTWNTQDDAHWSYSWGNDEGNLNNNEGAASDGDIIGHALDLDSATPTLKFYKNGSLVRTYTAYQKNVGYVPVFYDFSGSGNNTSIGTFNFGQDSTFANQETRQSNTDDNGYGDFYYSPPTGYLAMCTANLPTPTVVPKENFNAMLYTGTGSEHVVHGVGFQPDLAWFKSRSGSYAHVLFDSTRGPTKALIPNNTIVETTASATQDLVSFDTDGYTLGTPYYNGVNGGSSSQVVWSWKGNAGTTSTNTNGTITSTVQANPDAGFSIVSYTGTGTAGATVGHGLNSAPDVMLIKVRSFAQGWAVYHSGNTTSPETQRLLLHATSATASYGSSYWDSTAPTDSVFTIGDDSIVNYTSSSTHMAYCFHSVEGFSKFGSYAGNGSTDGTFVYTGFRPALIVVKNTTSATGWEMYDNERIGFNEQNNVLRANDDAAEITYSGRAIDLVSNGFKVRSSDTPINASGNDYVYMAFAENPFKHARAR